MTEQELGQHHAPDERKGVAFVFPGQGSQAVGMLHAAGAAEPTVRHTFVEASEALGTDLWAMAQDGPADVQALTANTQPLILTASIALYRVWIEGSGVRPAVAAGHSLGEFSALVAAGTMKFSDAVRLVRLRGQAMQEAVPVGEGAMAAVLGLDDDVINAVCATVSADSDHKVLAVNFNSPGQVVIAGHTPAVERAMQELKSAGAKRILPLPVSAPFHTPLMSPAAEVLEEALAKTVLLDPQIPVISNVDAKPHTDAASIARFLVKQVVAPVQWTGCVQTMIQMGCTRFVECGPGKVLSGLLRRIDRNIICHGIESPENLHDARGLLSEGASA